MYKVRSFTKYFPLLELEIRLEDGFHVQEFQAGHPKSSDFEGEEDVGFEFDAGAVPSGKKNHHESVKKQTGLGTDAESLTAVNSPGKTPSL